MLTDTSSASSLACAAATLLVGSTTSFFVRAQLTGRTEFTADVVATVYHLSGEVGEALESTHAFRRDGSHATVSTVSTSDGRSVDKRIALDIPSRRGIGIDGATESLMTTDLLYDSAKSLSTRIWRCAARSDAERRQTMRGFEAVRIERSLPGDCPEGVCGVTLVTWEAPELDCYPLRTEVYYHDGEGGALWLSNLREVRSVRLGEPDASLFAIPTDYAEWKPTDVVREQLRRDPSVEDRAAREKPVDSLSPLFDGRYFEQQKRP